MKITLFNSFLTSILLDSTSTTFTMIIGRVADFHSFWWRWFWISAKFTSIVGVGAFSISMDSFFHPQYTKYITYRVNPFLELKHSTSFHILPRLIVSVWDKMRRDRSSNCERKWRVSRIDCVVPETSFSFRPR